MNSSISSLAIVTDPRLNKTIPFTINYQKEETVICPYTIEEFNSCLENAPDLFQERFGMTTTEFKSVSDPYSLRKNMLADPNNYMEELLDDLLEEAHLKHGEIYIPPQKKQPLTTPIQRPPQTDNEKKSKKFERKTCTKCKKLEY